MKDELKIRLYIIAVVVLMLIISYFVTGQYSENKARKQARQKALEEATRYRWSQHSYNAK